MFVLFSFVVDVTSARDEPQAGPSCLVPGQEDESAEEAATFSSTEEDLCSPQMGSKYSTCVCVFNVSWEI